MAKYSYTYSGSNAAFIFAGVCTLPAGIAVSIEADQHKALQKNKFAKHLLDIDELAIEEIADDSKPTGRGRGANKSDLDKGDTSKVNVLTIDDVRKAFEMHNFYEMKWMKDITYTAIRTEQFDTMNFLKK